MAVAPRCRYHRHPDGGSHHRYGWLYSQNRMAKRTFKNRNMSADDPEHSSRSDSIDDLLAIMARLRDPQDGCPWDLKQTFRTILPYTLEEAYEVAEAIENDSMPDLCDELGDLLLQVVFHARMAEEASRFDFTDVVGAICDKMRRRHPHVFGTERFESEEALKANWEREKAAERAAKGADGRTSTLDGVARALPALVRAEKLQKRASHVGFDWPDVSGVFDKVREEVDECEELAEHDAEPSRRVHEVGDLLFACVNLARHYGVDAEHALRDANGRFERRFGYIESRLRERGLQPAAERLDEMDALWDEAKQQER